MKNRNYMAIHAASVVSVIFIISWSCNVYGGVSVFTGGDSGEGLDMQGNFSKAIDFGGNTIPINHWGGKKVGDALFEPCGSYPDWGNDVIIIADEYQWDSPSDFGESSNDYALSRIMDAGMSRPNTIPHDILVDLFVTPAKYYRLQLLFNYFPSTPPGSIVESGVFDIAVAGEVAAEGIDLAALTGGDAGIGVVFTHDFYATSSSLEIELLASDDSVPVIGAMTLEFIPEPTTAMVLGAGLLLVVRRNTCIDFRHGG